MGVKTIHWDVNIKINQPADTYPVIDQLLPPLYDGDPLGVARRPAVDSRVYADSQVLQLVPVKYCYTKGRTTQFKNKLLKNETDDHRILNIDVVN